MEFQVVCGVPAINAVDGKLDKYPERYVFKIYSTYLQAKCGCFGEAKFI